MSNAGRIAGIDDISQGIGLDLKPYVLGAAGNAPGRKPAGRPTGDVDVGARRVLQRDAGAQGELHGQHRLRRNRSRRAPHQPDALPAVLPGEARVLSRRRQLLRVSRAATRARSSAGASASTPAQPQPILYGAKLIGQAGRQDIGVLQVQHERGRLRTAACRSAEGRGLHRGPRQAPLRQRSRTSACSTRAARRASRSSIRGHTAGADVTVATPDFSATRCSIGRVVRAHLEAHSHRRRRARAGRAATRTAGTRAWRRIRMAPSIVVQGSAAGLRRGGRLHAAAELPALEPGGQLGAAASRTIRWIRGFAVRAPKRTSTSPSTTTSSIATCSSRRWSSSSTAATASSSRCSGRPSTSTRTSRSATA